MFTTLAATSRLVPDCIIFGHFQGEPLDSATKAAASTQGVGDALTEALKRPEATGEPGTIVEAHAARSGKAAAARVLLVGLGKKDKFECGSMRSIGASIGRRVAAMKSTGACIEVHAALRSAKVDLHEAGQACGEAIGLLAWVCDEFKGKATTAPSRVKLAIKSSNAEFHGGLERGVALAECANFTRTLSQTPPNVATPAWMAEQAQKMAKKAGLSCRVFKGAELEKEKLVGLINVGKASENKPCMIRLEYKPRESRGKPLVLVGKTMTYDTGGLSLKVNNTMVGMKRDKDGGCAVLGAMRAIATIVKPRRPVVALLSVAENSISDEAYRPDDVIRYRNNVTVEVTNTDAEGRLVLADALIWACEKEEPAAIIDIATLTGGVITALGSTYAGMFCEDDRLRAKVEAAASASGERVWRLPMHQEYRDMMKSPIADILNSNPNRKAHPIQGAAFLSYFVEEKVPWCHLDIAGVHVAEKNAGMFIDGPTGWGVRLFASLADTF